MSGISVRPLTVDDSERLTDLYRGDRDFLKLWDPERPNAFYTRPGQVAAIKATLRESGAGRMWAGAILEDESLVGRVNLNGILRGPLRSCFLGYWVAQPHNGRGIATKAVTQIMRTAFTSLGLHRVDAFAREDNPASCRVLEKNDFRKVGVSQRHVHINGRWHDDIIFQRLAPWDDGIRLEPAGE